MNPINISGLVLVGSGTEWFWSMLQFVIVAITLYAIYRQVRLQSSTAIEQIDRIVKDWTSETATRHTLALRLPFAKGRRVTSCRMAPPVSSEQARSLIVARGQSNQSGPPE